MTAAGHKVWHTMTGNPLTSLCGIKLESLNRGDNSAPGKPGGWTLKRMKGWREKQLVCIECHRKAKGEPKARKPRHIFTARSLDPFGRGNSECVDDCPKCGADKTGGEEAYPETSYPEIEGKPYPLTTR